MLNGIGLPLAHLLLCLSHTVMQSGGCGLRLRQRSGGKSLIDEDDQPCPKGTYLFDPELVGLKEEKEEGASRESKEEEAKVKSELKSVETKAFHVCKACATALIFT